MSTISRALGSESIQNGRARPRRRRRRLHRRPPGRRAPRDAASRSVRAVDVKPLDEWYQRLRRRREPSCSTSARCDALRARPPRARRRLQPRRRHGRHGLHREQQGALHALGADQHAHAAWPRATHGVERFFYSSSACVYAADKQTDAERHAAEGGGRLPGDARGRLRLGEALQRAHVPALPRGLRPRDPRRPLPQRLRPARHLRRRPREGAGRDLPQGRSRRSSPATTRSRSGATASRPAASCTSTTASRARCGSWTSDVTEPLNLGIDRAGDDQPAGRHRRGDRRHQARAAATTSTRRRACAAATATTRMIRERARLGAVDHARATGSSRPTAGSTTR